MDRRKFILAAPLALAACGNPGVWAPDDFVQSKVYVHPGPKRLTLFTVRNTGSNNGAHTGMMINASQRVLWDPAGTFGHESIPERNDVHFGATPRVEQFYLSYHSRITYSPVIQELDVPEATAEMALRLAMANGPTPKSFCTTHTSRLLMQLPGFGSIRTTFFPDNLEEQFAKFPGVRQREYRENDSDDKSVAAAEIDAAIRADQ